jgi:hypothetical protein
MVALLVTCSAKSELFQSNGKMVLPGTSISPQWQYTAFLFFD